MFNNGPAGALRLFDQQLGGQASWVLPLALVAIGLAVWQLISNGRGFVSSRRGQTTIVFGAWLLTAGAFFSVANFFHSYYLVTLGPPIAALAAVGVWGGWRQFRPSSPGVRILPLALIGTALVQAVLLGYYPTWSHWLSPIVIGGTALGCLGLVYGLVRASSSPSHSRVVMRAGAGLALAALLVVPAVWSGYSTLYSSRSGLPTAGPPVAGDRGLGFDPGPGAGGPVGPGGGRGFGGPGGIANPGGPAPGGFGGPDASLGSDLLDYLEANRGTATYLVATPDSNTAASIILASGGQPVMSLGGFSGSDPILTVDQFASMVRSGQVRFVLVAGRGGPQRSGTGSIMQWVEANGTPVPTTTMGASGSRQTQSQLYDLGRLQGVSA
jgi:4-amino-4-deoxy-L-arabinose transferase-like glycosyltransferase